MSLRLDTQWLAFLHRANPALLDNGQQGYEGAPPTLAKAGVAVAEVYIMGRYYHAVQLDGLASGETWKIQGRVGATFVDLAGITLDAANPIRQFTGVYAALKAVNTAPGSGGPTGTVTLLAMRP